MRIVTGLLLLLCASAVLAAEPITLDSHHQLFLDDYLIASMKNVTRTVEQAQKHPKNPLIWPSESWEEKLATIYGSVIRDGEKYRAWYKSGMGVGYAESDDGIKWTKPALDLVLIEDHGSDRVSRHPGASGPTRRQLIQLPGVCRLLPIRCPL